MKNTTTATIKLKSGNVKIDLYDPELAHFQTTSILFQAVEAYFEAWMDDNSGRDIHSMYNEGVEELNGGKYLSKKGAIHDGINALCEYMIDRGLNSLTSKDFYKADLDGVFQA